jgi:hypothetical protein
MTSDLKFLIWRISIRNDETEQCEKETRSMYDSCSSIHHQLYKSQVEMDRGLVTKTEAKALFHFRAKKKTNDKKVSALSKLFARLNKPYSPKSNLKLSVHKSITSEAMSYLVG